MYPLAAPYGPLTNTTIFEELQNAGITWKIYVNPEGTNCAATDSACLAGFSYINMFTYEQTILDTPNLLQNIVPISQFTTDAQNGTLPQVALIEPASVAQLDEHPNDQDTDSPIDIQAGASYAAGLINALMASPSWKDSAMIFTYDEPGGFYDHVSPQPPRLRVTRVRQPICRSTCSQATSAMARTARNRDLQFYLHRISRAADRDLAICQEELRFAHRVRLHGDPDAHREALQCACTDQSRRCPSRHECQISLIS